MLHAVENLLITLEEILASRADGLSEHALLKELAARKVTFFDEPYFSSPLGLFQRHFLLFHCLYRLRDRLRENGTGELTIHCLGIRIDALCDSISDHPVIHDPLAAYYLDLTHLESTEEADVLRLLESFWQRFANEEQRDEALAVIELAPPTSYPEIKRQYRRLAMRWHPDRGGDADRFQRLEWAMRVLRVAYQA